MSLALRRLLAGLVGASLIIGLTAVPSFAARSPEKVYRLDISPLSVGTGSATVELTFTNKTPGNSSFNSFEFTVPSPFTLVSASIVQAKSKPSQPGAVISSVGSRVTVVVLDPVKDGNYVTVAVNVTSSATGCAGATASWDPSAMAVWTGSNLSGSTFRLAEWSPLDLKTTINPGCVFRFGQQPSDAIAGNAIAPAVTVQLGTLVSGVFTPDESIDTGDVTLTTSPTATLAGSTATFSNGVATFTGLSVAEAGKYSLTATFGTFTATSNQFTVYEQCLDEEITIGNATVTPIGDTGTSCVPVTIDFNGTQITVLKPAGAYAEALVTIDAWDAETATNPIPATEVDTPGGWHPIQWCLGGPYDPTAAGFDPLAFNWNTISLPTGEVSCLLYQESHLTDLGQVQVSEHIYLAGDWSAKR